MPDSQFDKTQIAIVGAGASGLFLARLLSEDPKFRITIFEKNAQIATKLRASGGGRANIFNNIIAPTDYNAPYFAEKVLKKVNPDSLKQQFLDFGLITVSDSENRVYPITQFSQTVVNVLADFPKNNVEILTETPVYELKNVNEKWFVNDIRNGYDILVLASGSPANMISKQQIGYNDHLNSLNLTQIPLKPALTGFLLKNYPRRLSGCRAKAVVSLFQGNSLIHKEKGEVVFKDDGISGIVVMNMSSYYQRLKNPNNCRLSLNMTYWDDGFDVARHLKKYGSLKGLLHPKLLSYYEQQRFDIQDFTFEIKDTYPIDAAQVCSGGIDLEEIDDNFSSKSRNKLYILGEMLNVDGVCGGYNLFFAFASATVAAQKIKNPD